MKMKGFVMEISSILLAACVAACNWIPEDENARIVFKVAGTKVTDAEVNDFILTVSSGEKNCYHGRFADRPQEMLVPAGEYSASLSSGGFECPGFDAPLYGDSLSFSLEAGQTSTVTLNCTLQNAGLRLTVTDNFKAVYPGGPLSVSQDGASLEYAYDCSRTAYFRPGDVFISFAGEVIATVALEKGVVNILELDAEKKGSRVTFCVNVAEAFTEKRERAVIGPLPVLSVAQAKQIPVADSLKACVCGHIVGGVKNNKAVMAGSEGYDISANILLADEPSDSTLAVCLPVELKTADLKAALSITDNPSLAGKKVRITGTLLKYFNTVGMKAVTEYEVL